ncbi:MAG: hypothetical protein GPJ52_09025 [Candidatus Heimdallarchaeota archaeon]|nr:hypothetical protein [Candidatus Heimdallarchaeota archaeon]
MFVDWNSLLELENIYRIYLPIWHFTEFIIFISVIPVLFFAISLIQYVGINPKLHGDRTLKVTSYIWLISINYFVYNLLFMRIFLSITDSISLYTFRDNKLMIALYVILSITMIAFVTTLSMFIKRKRFMKKLEKTQVEGERDIG